MFRSIVLIGPSLAGKTTLSKLIGERLNLPVIELDILRWDYDESVQILRERVAALGFDPDGDMMAMNSRFLQHHSNRDLATLTVYTDWQTPEQTCTSLIAQLKEAGLTV
jgi:adenylate kinase family enzyme